MDKTKTKKAFREWLNNKFKDYKWRNFRYGNRKAQYGDYLYNNDPDKFRQDYERWLENNY